jgi:hypothetical protein
MAVARRRGSCRASGHQAHDLDRLGLVVIAVWPQLIRELALRHITRWTGVDLESGRGPAAGSNRRSITASSIDQRTEQHHIAGGVGAGIAGTYNQNGGANNQRLWLNGAVEAQASVSGALQAGSQGMGIGEEISGVSDLFDHLIDTIRDRRSVVLRR